MTPRMLRAVALGLGLCLIAGAASASGDPAAGRKIFRKCAVCHSLKAGKHKIGPSLHGVIGRTPGTAPGYKYSKAMKAHGASGIVWNEETLDTYLTAPRKVVKGTKMAFPGLKSAQQRADVIAYLKQASGP
ncbi:MAG: c-type cytochrome [Kiloniellaceae bacterium]